MFGGTELLVLVVLIAGAVLIPRLQRRLEERVDEDDLGRRTLERIAGQHQVQEVQAGLPVQILEAFANVRPLRFTRYRVHLSDQPGVNAVALPGGIVILTVGLLRLVKAGAISPDELAAVLAHELGHIELGHSRQAEVREQMTRWALAVPRVGGGLVGRIATQVGLTALRRRASREAEREADAWASSLLAESPWEASALVSFLRKCEQWSAGGGLWSTHPSPKERIAALTG